MKRLGLISIACLIASSAFAQRGGGHAGGLGRGGIGRGFSRGGLTGGSGRGFIGTGTIGGFRGGSWLARGGGFRGSFWGGRYGYRFGGSRGFYGAFWFPAFYGLGFGYGYDPFYYGYGYPYYSYPSAYSYAPAPAVVAGPGYGGYGNGYAYENENAPPRNAYQAPEREEWKPPSDLTDYKPTPYLIALKDHNVREALTYWVENGTLHYVTPDHAMRETSLASVDREQSERLNRDRQMNFRLPAAP